MCGPSCIAALREATALHERALSLNPNLAMAWALSGGGTCLPGRLGGGGRRRGNRYKKLSPLRSACVLLRHGASSSLHLLKRDYESAVVAGRAVTRDESFVLRRPSSRIWPRWGMLGRMQEASVVRARLLALEPDFTIERFLADDAIEQAANREIYAERVATRRRSGNDKGRRRASRPPRSRTSRRDSADPSPARLSCGGPRRTSHTRGCRRGVLARSLPRPGSHGRFSRLADTARYWRRRANRLARQCPSPSSRDSVRNPG